MILTYVILRGVVSFEKTVPGVLQSHEFVHGWIHNAGCISSGLGL